MDILGITPLTLEIKNSYSPNSQKRSRGWHCYANVSSVTSKSDTHAIQGYHLSNTYKLSNSTSNYGLYEFTPQDLSALKSGRFSFFNIKHFLHAKYAKGSSTNWYLFYITYIDGKYSSYIVVIDMQYLTNNVELELPFASNVVYACIHIKSVAYSKVYDGLIWDGFKSAQFYNGITTTPDTRAGGDITHSNNVTTDWKGFAENFKYNFTLPSSAYGSTITFRIEALVPYTDAFKKINISRSRTYPMYAYAFIEDLNGMLSTCEFTWRFASITTATPLSISSSQVQVDPLNKLMTSISVNSSSANLYNTFNVQEQSAPVASIAVEFKAAHSLGTYPYNLNFNLALLISDNNTLTKDTFIDYMRTNSMYSTTLEFPRIIIG